jgi:hypothetical protein
MIGQQVSSGQSVTHLFQGREPVLHEGPWSRIRRPWPNFEWHLFKRPLRVPSSLEWFRRAAVAVSLLFSATRIAAETTFSPAEVLAELDRCRVGST